MDKIEAGAIANPDENRMVGHYWLRDPDRAPTPKSATKSPPPSPPSNPSPPTSTPAKSNRAQNGQPFTELLVIGIGGSALGPEFVADALTSPHDKMKVHFFDNTDPDGMDRVLAQIGKTSPTLSPSSSPNPAAPKKPATACSPPPPLTNTHNLDFPKHAVAITGDGSELDKVAVDAKLARTLPHVGLGRRTHLRTLRRRPPPRRPPRHRHRRHPRRRHATPTSSPACTTP